MTARAAAASLTEPGGRKRRRRPGMAVLLLAVVLLGLEAGEFNNSGLDGRGRGSQNNSGPQRLQLRKPHLHDFRSPTTWCQKSKFGVAFENASNFRQCLLFLTYFCIYPTDFCPKYNSAFAVNKRPSFDSGIPKYGNRTDGPTSRDMGGLCSVEWGGL